MRRSTRDSDPDPSSPVTADEVRASTFTPVRFREGYEMGEVDDFLDRVADRLAELEAEVDALRAAD